MLFRDIPKATLIGLIRGYAYLVSPLLGPKCRFYPSCSCYAAEAVEVHGVVKGSVMALRRLLKCHPWYRGQMIDPVPASIDWPAVIGYKRAKDRSPHICGCTNHQTKE